MKPRLIGDDERLGAAELARLDERARRESEREIRVEQERVVWCAEFPIGDARFAVPLDRLEGAVPLRFVAPVPLAPANVVGILPFRGDIVTALSLASLLGVRGWRRDPSILLLVRRPGRGLVGLDCERVPNPVALARTAVDAATAIGHGVVSEVLLPEKEIVHLIDVDALLAARAETDRVG